jgi:hypothetical protein
MIAAIANSLSNDNADKRISVIEAGTGTGKTVGYLIAALPIARALKKKVFLQGLLLFRSSLSTKIFLSFLRHVVGIIVALWLKGVVVMPVIFAWSSV